MSKRISRKKIEKVKSIFTELSKEELDGIHGAKTLPEKYMHEGQASAYYFAAATLKHLLETGEVRV